MIRIGIVKNLIACLLNDPVLASKYEHHSQCFFSNDLELKRESIQCRATIASQLPIVLNDRPQPSPQPVSGNFIEFNDKDNAITQQY